MSEVARIIERLEKGERPSRGLDADIAIAFDIIVDREWWSINYINSDMIPCYSASIDAAIGLCGRLLPGWFWRCGSTSLFPRGWAHVSRTDASNCGLKDEAASADGKAATPAIALCIAILKAKVALSTPNHPIGGRKR